MEQSFFMEREHSPGREDLKQVLKEHFLFWEDLIAYVLERCPSASEDWQFSKFGWNCQIKDKKRVILYLMPGNGVFRASLVLGRKALEEALTSDITQRVKTIIAAAKTYAEGTGVRIDVNDKGILADVQTLITLKLKY